ncbi:MAG: GAF domain-containing protein, partial [Chloroflexota bacterium]
RATQVIGETLYPDNFGILLLDEAARVLRVHRSYRVGQTNIERTDFPVDQGISGRVVASGQPRLAPDVSRDPDYFNADGNTRSELCVPIKIGERVIGVINAESIKLAAFSPADLRLLTTFAQQLATAIEKIRLFQAEHIAREQAEALREVAGVLNASLDREPLLQLILEQLARVVDYDSASLMLLSGDMLRIVAQRGFRSESQQLSSLQIEALHHLHDTIRLRAPVIIPDTNANPHWVHVPGSEYIRCWMGVPLIAKDRVIGLLNLDKGQVRFYTESDARLAAAFAHQAVVAIENARLYEITNHTAAEMRATSDILRSLNLGHDVVSAFPDIAAGLRALTGCDRASVALLDDALETVTVVAVDQDRAELGQGTRIPVSHSSASEDVLVGRIHFSPDLAAETAFIAERAIHLAGYRSRVNLPLRVGERIIGALNLVWNHTRGYDGANLPLLGQIADSIALAIEKSRLLEETRHRDAILEALAYASERLLMPGDLGHALPDLLAQLGRAAGVSRVYVFKNHRAAMGALLTSKQYEWAAPGQPELKNDQIIRNFDYVAQGFGRWVDTLGGGQPLAGVVRGFPAAERALLQSEDIRSLVVAPIFSGGVWWGLLGFDEREHERHWLNAEIEALKNVAGALGAAIARQQTETDEREQRALAEALRDTAAALNGTLNFDEVLDRILANVGKVVPHITSSVVLIESGVGRIARCRGFAERGQEEAVLSLRFPVAGLSKLQRMVETGQPLAVADVSQFPGWFDVPETRWISSHASALIRVKGQVIGMLNLDSDTPGFFTESHARRLQAFADQAAIAIENARLYDELSALYRASSDLINPGDDARSLAQHIAEIVTREFPFAHCGLLMVDEAQTHLLVMGHIGLNIHIAVETVPLNGRGLTVAAFKSGRSIYAPDTGADDRYLAAHPDTRSEFAVPLQAGGHVIGALDLQSPDLDAFDGRTQRIVTAFAEHAALALENARLLGRVEEARRIAEEASNFKSEFLANTSHELRTPLTGIIGSLSVVVDELCDSREEEREFVQIAYTASQRLLAIISDVLDIAKIEAGKIEVQPQAVAVSRIFGEVEALTRLQAEQKKLRLDFLPPPESSAAVWADPDRLRQILLNLVGNAIKFTEQGEIVVSVGVEARELRFSVRDTGIGVALDKQHKLFQPFVQADGSMTRKYGGTGLGLSISRRLAELMGGSLTLHSEGEGRGSEFILTLPASDPTGFA